MTPEGESSRARDGQGSSDRTWCVMNLGRGHYSFYWFPFSDIYCCNGHDVDKEKEISDFCMKRAPVENPVL